MFIDVAKITLISGAGGNGSVSFFREKYVPNGGPDGGDGGDGGSIYFVADEGMRTLMDFRYARKYRAEEGGRGKAEMKRGKNGEDFIIRVPAGTVVKDEEGRVLADLFTPGDRQLVLPGGKGGKGNARFATATRQAPTFAEDGEKALELVVQLELKTIADIGLVGYPNVGKSTILSVLTRARPKIANYHFTTLTPNLGVIEIDGESFVMADIPGLIEGAAEGVGLGHDFLRHVERTRLLWHVVDISGSEGRDPIADYETINAELAAYHADLAQRPQLVLANKNDLGNFEEALEALAAKGAKVYKVSAATTFGFKDALRESAKLLLAMPPQEPLPRDEVAVVRRDSTSFAVMFDGTRYEVSGPAAENLLGRVDLTDAESMAYFQQQLRKMGIVEALRDKGAKEGSTVRMCGLEFEFVE